MDKRTSPFAEDVTRDHHGIRLDALPRGSVWQVACWPDTYHSIEKSLAMACGCPEPAPGQIAETRDGRLLIRIEPLKWWIIGEDDAECPMCPGPADGAWLDMSHDQAGVSVTGANAVEILKRMVPIDLRERSFPNNSYATTHMHHMITRVLRRDNGAMPHYEVMVMRSYADDLREIVQHHLHQYD